MLKCVKLLLSGILFALLASCTEEKITPNSSFQFQSDQQQHEFERRALAGDIKAARALANYYVFLHNDYKKGVYWLRVAAKHGDKISEQNIRAITRED